MRQKISIYVIRHWRLFAVISACLLVTLLAYASLIPKFAKIELSSKADPWNAGVLSAPQTTLAHETYLTEHPLWILSDEANAALAANSQQAALVNWRFKGVVKDGKALYALIEVADSSNAASKYIRVHVGEKLPNGEDVVDITEQQITIKIDQQTSQIRLYQNSKNGKP